MKLSNFFLLALGAISLTVSSCSNGGETSQKTDYSEILGNTAENVILKTYQSLAENALILKQATDALENNPTAENLTSAKNAWIAARSPWEQSEGFLFGPVDQEGLDPSLDSWPVNVTDLNNVLSSNNSLTVEFLAQQEGTLKGFHTIEYLLWGTTGNKQVTEFTTREFEYLAAASGALETDAQKLFNLWRPESGNYIENILTAGNGSPIYVSQKSAVEEFVSAMIVIADEVANGKINDPLVQQDLTLEESRFSANSKADFSDNIRSIKNIYTGKFGAFGNGKSVSEIVSEKKSSLNTKVTAEIEAAIQSIENIPGTFSDAVFNNAAAASEAQNKVRILQATLEEQVQPLISNLEN
ncbi:imelysin [bacterium]|nr:imelysin [bacterium]